jgi:hypothetical protein
MMIGLNLALTNAATLNAARPELVTNGTFNTNLDGWTDASTAPSTMIWSGGQAVAQTDGVAAARLRATVTTVIGKSYTLSSTGTIPVGVGTTAGNANILTIMANTSRDFVAQGTTTHIATATVANGATLDNVSIR